VGALLITPIKGKDLFRSHPFNLGLCGSFSHSLARRYVDAADCVLVFGASLNLYTTSKGTFFPDVPVVQVDADRSHIGRYYTADIAIVGDARLVAEQMADAAPDRPADEKPFHTDAVRAEIAAFDMRMDFKAEHTARTLDPRALAMRLGELLPADRTMVYDAGNFLLSACYIPVSGPERMRFTSDFASMGAGFGTALGVAAARPDAVTVLMVGDGGFMMTMSELETVARLALRMVVVVFNDCAYGAELQMCRINNMAEATSLFPDIDLAPLAEALGSPVSRCERWRTWRLARTCSPLATGRSCWTARSMPTCRRRSSRNWWARATRKIRDERRRVRPAAACAGQQGQRRGLPSRGPAQGAALRVGLYRPGRGRSGDPWG
jgi:thiamine pyrophosphate-dependent acetolactate synthase large subunit-like protein